MAASAPPGSVMATKALPGLAVREAAHPVLLAVPEVGQEGERLGGGARLGGDDPEGARRVERRVEGRDGLGIGRVEDADAQAHRPSSG